jgi:hypothetical protein
LSEKPYRSCSITDQSHPRTGKKKFVFAGEDGQMECLSRLYWRAIDPVASAIELAKCRLVDWLCGPFPETPADRPIGERGDRRFTNDPDQ